MPNDAPLDRDAQAARRLEGTPTAEELQHFFEHSLDLLCVAGFDGYFKRLNPQWERVFGYTVEELLAEPYLNFIHPDDRGRTGDEAERNAAGGETPTFENRYRCKDGSYRWLLWTAMPSKDEQLIYAIARDNTERREAEEALRKASAELAAANRELEAFSYSVSHDLRSPLRAIDGFSRVLEEEYAGGLDEEGKRLLQAVRAGASRMGQLIDDLLAFSRAGRRVLESQAIDMTALARAAFDEAALLEPGRTIDFRLHALPPVIGDPAMLRQAWFNLIDNAVKYTRPRERATIEVSAAVVAGMVRFTVRDNGVGFDARYVHKLFNVFERLHAAHEFEGTGVGLALVRRIVERHGGSVNAESEVGEGSTFEFTLPGQIGNN